MPEFILQSSPTMGLLDYADELRGRLKGLLGGMPIVQAAQGKAEMPTMSGLLGRLKEMPVFDPVSGAQDAYGAGLNALTFAGVGAKTADKAALARAQKMAESGADRGAIWNETGWFKGPDNKWRFEIDDSAAAMESGGKFFGANGGGGEAAQVMSHPELFAAYPDMAKMPVSYTFSGKRLEGSYYPTQDYIYIKDPMGVGSVKSPTLHEMQHAIQQREGFSRGGSPLAMAVEGGDELAGLSIRIKAVEKLMREAEKRGSGDYAKLLKEWQDLKSKATDLSLEQPKDPYEAYMRIAGEAEARAVQNRLPLTAEQRKRIPPWNSYDRTWDQLTVKY